MNYLEAYFSRLYHYGKNTGERITNGGIRTFQRWKAESPHTVPSLSVERGLYFDGIILQSKDKAYQKIMHLNVSNDIPIQVGDIMNWQLADGTIEKWLLLSEERKTNGTYRTFDIIRCNYLIKWVNDKGYLRQSWAYVLSSTDEKVKGNFRTWHNLITPQPNKYAEIIMPRPIDENSQVKDTVDRGTNFIIEDESWKMVEADFTSVKGIIYMSLTENKVNFQYDDLNVDIADTDKLLFPTLEPVYVVGEEIVPNFTKQTLNEWQIVLEPQEKQTVVGFNENGKLIALNPGSTIIKMRLKNHNSDQSRKAVTKEFEVVVNASAADAPAYIYGPDKVRLDRYANYYLALEGQEENPLDYEITISNGGELGELAYDKEHRCYVLHTNNKNKLGKLTLAVSYNDKICAKTVEVIPLW